MNDGDYLVVRRLRDPLAIDSYPMRYHDFTFGISQLHKLVTHLQAEGSLRSDLWKAKFAAVARTVDTIDCKREILKQIPIIKNESSSG